MKITDQQLMQAIWRLQLKTLAKQVLHTHPQGQYSVVYEHWYAMSSGVHIMDREELTPLLGRQQLLKRIRSLYKKGLIKTHYGARLSTFYIDSDAAKLAFEAARNWWLNHRIGELTLTKHEFELMHANAQIYLIGAFGCEVAA